MRNADRIEGIVKELRALAPAGFAAAFHVSFSAPRYLFQTYDPDWMEYYSSAGVVMDDPAVRWGFANVGIADWDALVEMDERKVFDTARAYGLNHWTVVATDAEDSKSFGAFARKDAPFTDAEKQLILDLLTEAHCLSVVAPSDPKLDSYLSKMSLRLTHKGLKD